MSLIKVYYKGKEIPMNDIKVELLNMIIQENRGIE